MEQLELAEPYNKLLLGRAPQDEGQVPDSNNHMFPRRPWVRSSSEGGYVSLQVRPSPFVSIACACFYQRAPDDSRAWPLFGRHTRNHLSTVATVNSEILVGRQDDRIGKRFGHANEASIGEAHGNVGVFLDQLRNRL